MIRRFNRYELKYVLPLWKCQRIMAELKGFAEPDPHGGRDGYPIVSLYYDSPDLSCFWAKVDGIKFRRKLRLRIYPGPNIEDTRFGMVEIKQRTNRTVQKRRLELPLEVAERLCRGEIEATHLEQLNDLDQEVASEVLYLVSALHLRPAAITAYDRIAYVGSRYESGLRITFDSNLRGRVHGLEVNNDAENHRLMHRETCVMEVKSDDSIPDWVTSLLARHSCQTQRVSKYCATIAQLSSVALPPWASANALVQPVQAQTAVGLPRLRSDES
jgi:SPX domain protein involved in polyphosphate accumulation